MRHGHRLDLAEYERRLRDLYASSPAKPSRQERRGLDRAEFELRIDYRLGAAFPSARREALWAAQMRVRERWWRPLLLQLTTSLARKVGGARRSGRPRFIEAEFARVLDQDELEAFLGDD